MPATTTDTPADQRLIAREEAAFARAAEADKRIQTGKHFLDWLAIGEGLAALRDRAIRESRSNSAYGPNYKRAYAEAKAAHPWASHYDPAAISHACWLHDNATDVLRWRETLTRNQRDAWTTPRVVHQHYDRMTRVPEPRAADAKPTPTEALQAEVTKLREENRRLREADGLSPTEPVVSVHVLIEKLVPLFERVQAQTRVHQVEFSRTELAMIAGDGRRLLDAWANGDESIRRDARGHVVPSKRKAPTPRATPAGPAASD